MGKTASYHIFSKVFDGIHFILAGNNDIHKSLNEFEIWRDRTMDAIFPTVTLSVAMETSGRIWLNFELIQALMHVLITCKYEKDLIKNSGENVMTSFYPL